MKIITSRDQIPEHMSDSDAAEFWSNHTLSDELLEASIIEDSENDLPKRKSATISIRLDEDLLQRIRTLAKLKSMGYQTLIKEFLVERTYEEEKKISPLYKGKYLSGKTTDNLALERQLEKVFEVLQPELSQMSSGTIVVLIRNNLIGKFGVRTSHLAEEDKLVETKSHGLTVLQQQSLLRQAIDALKFKTNWVSGEIHFNFALQHNELRASVQFESSYSLSKLTKKFGAQSS